MAHKTNSPRLLLALVAAAGLAACGSIPKKTFIIDAITTNEKPCPCLVVVDDDWDTANQERRVVNADGVDELQLTLEFNSAEVEITVAPFDPNVGTLPRTRTEAVRNSNFLDDKPRRIRIDDPVRHMFVMKRK